MFWKTANIPSWSLVTKLMVLYALSMLGILAALALFLYPSFMALVQQVNANGSNSYLTIECYKNLIIALLASVFTAIVMGHLIARNGLNRIHEFATKVEKITANSLHERINSKDWPSELETLGARFNTMLDRIQTAFIQISQFSSDVAHELRNPINHLQGTTELALLRDKSVDEYKQLLVSHQEEYHYLSRLIENLFFLAHADHGQMTLKKQSFDAQAAILKISDYFQATADENNVAIICEGNAELWADAMLFKRMMNNLLANAFKYMPNGGQLRIDIAQHDTQHVKIAVHDSGIGIATEHLPHLFDRFYRADRSRSSESGGLGLGLTIVKSIVDLHQGKILVESKVNVGTSVYLMMPVA